MLSIIAIGHVHAESLEPLARRYARLEQLVLDLPPRCALTERRAEVNRAVDAASSDWILILREREQVGEALAGEIAAVVHDDPRAWGFRIRTVPLYAGKPLRLGFDEGEVRLFHRRHLLRRGEVAVQGTVVRLENALEAITFASTDDHRAYLARDAAPHSRLRQTALFLRQFLGARTLDANTLRYLWIEAGFDVEADRR
jgi:hypothetical protein